MAVLNDGAAWAVEELMDYGRWLEKLRPPLPSEGSMSVSIVTGDDFGISRGIKPRHRRAHLSGIVTSTSLMVTGQPARRQSRSLDGARR